MAALVVGWLGCRLGGPRASPDEYVAYPSDADDGGGGSTPSSDSPGDDSTISASDDGPGDDSNGSDASPPGTDGGCDPSMCPNTGCQFGTTPCCNNTNTCGCGYNDGAICL